MTWGYDEWICGTAVSTETHRHALPLLLRKPDEIFPTASNTRITGVTEHLILRYFIVLMITVNFICDKLKKGKTTPVTGCGGLYGCETSTIPHFLDNRLTHGGNALNLTCRPPFNSPSPGKFLVLISGRG
jgi:hypothetical protein